MPEINNINNVRNIDQRRTTSKLSFEVGEVFQARVVDVVKQGNEVVLKMPDGWQFTANTKTPMEITPEGLIRFKVVGYEDGKLQVVIAPTETEGNAIEEKSIEKILKQQNLSSSKEDIEMFKNMIKHDMPLTRENISYVKTIMDFKEKMNSSEEEENVFISKYIQSKGIDLNSQEAKQISETLKGFFKELKQASLEDILTLKENGLELNEDNLKSFNKIFKGDTELYKELVDIFKNKVIESNETGSSEEFKIVKEIIDNNIELTKENVSNVKTVIDLKEKILTDDSKKETFINKFVEKNGIALDSEKGKELVKNINEFLSAVKNEPIKEIIESMQRISEHIETDSKGRLVPKNIKEEIPTMKAIIKGILNTENTQLESTEPSSIENFKMVKSIIDNKIELTEENISNVKTVIDLKEKILTDDSKKETFINKFVEKSGIALDSEKGRELVKNINEFLTRVKNEPIKEIIESMKRTIEGIETDGEGIILPKNIKEEIPTMKAIIKGILNTEIESNGLSSSEEVKIVNTIIDNKIELTEENISNVKTVIDLKEKILTEDSKKETFINKFVEKSGIALDSDEGKKLIKNINEFLSAVKNQPIKEIVESMQKTAEVIETDIDSNGMNVPKNIKEEIPTMKGIIREILNNQEINKNNQLSENVKNEITQKTDLMKNVINSIKEGDWSLLKNSINDIKVFNSVSNQYYFMDVPLNINQKEYECKLLIKDERKKGKKIDSKNVKMMVSVKTINIGKVDAFIKVQERNISIDLKCTDKWVKILQNENQKLYDVLEQLNYNVAIKVEKRIDEANIVTTRDFFQDNTMGSINTMV